MTKEKVTAVIDSNEASQSDIVEKVINHPDIEDWRVDSLKTGDLILSEVCIIEIKGISDFASSISGDDNRMYSQAERMMNSDYPQKFVLLKGNTGDFENLQHTDMSPKALRGAMASITVRYGVPVIPVGDMETVIDMGTRYARKEIEEPSSTVIKSGSITSKEIPQTVRILSAIDGIGEEAAFNLYSRYPTVEAILGASVEELMETPQVGEERARNVHRTLSGDSEGDSGGNQTWTST